MKDFFAFENTAGADIATLSIYDVVGFYGSQARDFQRQLSEIKAKKIVVRISSPGGSVFDGYAIYNLLRAHSAKIEVHIDGVAASIAATIAMAGDTIIMPQNAMLMVHMPLGDLGMANAEEMRAAADTLDKLALGIIGVFANRTGETPETVRGWLAERGGEGTWFTADEAFAVGLADKVSGRGDFSSLFDPKAFFNTDRLTETFPAAPENKPEIKPDINIMTPEAIAAMQAENTRLKTFEASADMLKQSAADKALTDYKAAQRLRLDGIKAHADKYNRDGDLDTLVANAVAGDMTLEAFKDGVTEIMAKRGTKEPLKPGTKGGETEALEDGQSDFVAAYNATAPGSQARRMLVRERKTEARAALRAGRVS